MSAFSACSINAGKLSALLGYVTTPTDIVTLFLPKPFTEDRIKEAIDDALHKRLKEAGEAAVEEGETEEEKLVQKRQIIEVLNRTSEDEEFWRDLMEQSSEALEGYRLSSDAKAAILSGDLKWINENVGELTQKQLMFIYKRLEREAW